jgi:hypothetical protein
MTARHLSIHRAERRATQVVFVTALWVVQHGVLGWFWAGETAGRIGLRRKAGVR